MWVKKQQLEPYMEQLIGLRLRKEYIRSVCCHHLFNLYTEHIMRNAALDELQAGIKIDGRNINNLRYVDNITSNGRKGRGTKKPLDESEGGEWKSWLKTKKNPKNQDHDIQSDYFMAKRRRKGGIWHISSFWALKHCRWWQQLWNQKMIASWQESYEKPWQCVENQSHYSADKDPNSQGCGLPSGHVWLWELVCKEGKMPKNWCLPTVVLEKTPESPLDGKEIEPVSLKVNQPWILIERTDAEASASVVWSSDMKSWLTGKVTDVGKDWGLKEKRASEDEMTGCITDAMNMNLGKLREVVRDREGWGIAMSWTCLGNWTTTSFPSKEWVSAF